MIAEQNIQYKRDNCGFTDINSMDIKIGIQVPHLFLIYEVNISYKKIIKAELQLLNKTIINRGRLIEKITSTL